MPTLHWLNKEEHIKADKKVPYRVLEPDLELSYGDDSENMIIQGDNLDALKSLLPYYAGKVKCIFIDPPYNTGNAFEHYDDNLEHSTWLGIMYPRLVLLRQLLAEDGVIFVQIDDNQSAYLKVILDEIFGRNNMINSIVVNMSNLSGPKIQHAINGKRFPKIKEYIHIYRKSTACKPFKIPKRDKHTWDDEYNMIIPTFDEHTLENILNGDATEISSYRICSLNTYIKDLKIKDKDIKQWKLKNSYRIFASKPNEALLKKAKDMTFTTNIAIIQNSSGDKKLIKTDFNENTSTARIELVSAKKNMKVFYGDHWDDICTTGGVGQEGQITFVNSKKPEKLIERVIKCCTTESDLVLDSFLGSGTTCAVAQKMGRKYIGIEMGEHAKTHCVPRLQKVIDGEQGGISKNINWTGGGGFKFYSLGDEIFTADGQINKAVKFSTLARHIWFSETKTPITVQPSDMLLGIYENTAYILLYNGILGDRRPTGGNVLTRAILQDIQSVLPDFTGNITVYGESCRLGTKTQEENKITFKQTPYDVRV